MNAKDKAKELVDKFRIILMNEDTDCGNEILCTLISKECAKISVDEILKQFVGLNKLEYVAFDCLGERQFTFEGEYEDRMTGYDMIEFWNCVLKEIDLM